MTRTDSAAPASPDNVETQPEAPQKRVVGRPFTKGNPGRKPGPNRVTAEAKDWALPLVPEVLARRLRHRRGCDATKSCAQCRHYDTMVIEYAYGKAPQRTELIMAGLKADTEALTKAMGGTEAEAKAAVAEVQRRYAELKDS